MERTFQYVEAVKGDTAIMRLKGHIGPNPNNENEPYLNADYFIDEMKYLKNQGKKIHVRINSVGGNVLKGWDIYDAVQECKASTHCYGLAASMAGIILAGGRQGHRTCDSHSTTMLHGPHLEVPGTSPYLSYVRDGFKKLLETRTTMSAEKIGKMMDNGDHYFDASDMLECGIVDEVVNTGIRVNKKVNASLLELCDIYSSLETQKTEEMETPKWLTAIFGGSTEQETMSAAMKSKEDLSLIQAKSDTLALENTALKGRLAALEVEIAASKVDEVKKKATDLVEKAITDKKIIVDETQKADLIKAATDNFAVVELMLSQVGGAKKIASVAASVKEENKGAAGMTYEEMAVKHPETLAKIAAEQPELFNAMADEMNTRIKAKK